MPEPSEMEGAALNGMWSAEDERDKAEQQRDRLLEAVKEFIEAPPSFSVDERLRLWRLAEEIEGETK